MVNIQLLSELEEIIHCLMDPDRKQQLQQNWWNRLLVRGLVILCDICVCVCVVARRQQKIFDKRSTRIRRYKTCVHVCGCLTLNRFLSQGCQRNVEDWQKILQVRSLVLNQQVHVYKQCIDMWSASSY